MKKLTYSVLFLILLELYVGNLELNVLALCELFDVATCIKK